MEKKDDIFAGVAFPQSQPTAIDDVTVKPVEIIESKIPGVIPRDSTGRPSFGGRKYPERNRNNPDRKIPAHDPVLYQKRLEDAQRRIFTQAVNEGLISSDISIDKKTIASMIGKAEPIQSLKAQFDELSMHCPNRVWVYDFLCVALTVIELPKPFVSEIDEGVELKWIGEEWQVNVTVIDKKAEFIAQRKTNKDCNEFEIDLNRERNAFMFSEVLAQHLFGLL